MLSQETIQNIRNKASIVDIISALIPLKLCGENYVAPSPFSVNHEEENAERSLVVSPRKNVYFCFATNHGGDSIRFLMQYGHFSEQEAWIWIANRYGVIIPQEELDSNDATNEVQELYYLHDLAQQFFTTNLNNSEMGRAIGLSYLKEKRKLSDDIIARFGLGYSPDEWTALTDYATREGFSDNALRASSLTIFKDNGKKYDRFKGRITFPIFNTTGRVVAYSCRTLSADKEVAKYMNSENSAIYNKSQTLYGLFQARDAIVAQKKCYLVEGNVDVVSMHMSGVENTVASCGTAFTKEQASLIKQYTDNVVIVYDGDSAGIKATIRATDILLQAGLNIRMVLFPDGEDPDSYAQKYGAEQLRDYLANNEKDFISYRIMMLAPNAMKDPIKKSDLIKELVKSLSYVQDRTERDNCVRKCVHFFGVNENTLQIELLNCINNRLKKNFDQTKPTLSSPPGDPFPFPPELPPDFDPDGNPIPPIPADAPPTSSSKPNWQEYNIFPDEIQERKIISLLINNGNDIISVLMPKEKPTDKDVFEQQYVVSVIVSDIVNDEIQFDNPVYQQIFGLFLHKLEAGGLLDSNELVNHPDEVIRNTSIELMINTYHISERWQNEKHVYVVAPEQRVKEDVEYSLNTLKLKKINHRIDDIDTQLRLASDPETMRQLLFKKMVFIKHQKELCNQLRCVIH